MTEMLICRMQGNTQMINIAICDDDVAMTATIEKMLYVIAKEQNIKISSAVFSFLTALRLLPISDKVYATT